MKTKVCRKCKRELPATPEYFFRSSKNKDGLQSPCKECKGYKFKKPKPKAKEGYKFCSVCGKELPATTEFFNKESSNPFKLSCRCKECNKIKWKKYYAKNGDKVRERAKINSSKRHKEYYQKNKEKHKEGIRRSRAKNPDLYRTLTQKRLALKRKLPNTMTVEHWEMCKKYFENSCAYCGAKPDILTQEHFIPLSKGGGYTPDNIIPACFSCNSSKHNKNFFDWYPQQEFYSKEREQKILEYLNMQKNSKSA